MDLSGLISSTSLGPHAKHVSKLSSGTIEPGRPIGNRISGALDVFIGQNDR